MKKLYIKLMGLMVVLIYLASCSKPLVFPDLESPGTTELKDASARLLWIGAEYKVVVQAKLDDEAGITKVQIKNGEWQLDSVIVLENRPSYTIDETFVVPKDVNTTKHSIELTITNNNGGIEKVNIDVEDLSAENTVPGYAPDLLPPAITVTKPTVTKYYGLDNEPINVQVEALITDADIAAIEVKLWGETAGGEPVLVEDLINPVSQGDKEKYQYSKMFSLPAGKVGDYQYLVKSTDVSGNKTVKGGTITVGLMDKLYLSDAENETEVLNQGFDHMGGSRGLGTLISMKKQGANTFVADVYYRNETTDNIRFIAFLGTESPYKAPSQSKLNYTLNGVNVVAMSSGEQGKVTNNLSAANFKLPVTQKGYYKVTVDMTARTVKVTPFTPVIPNDAVKYPGYATGSGWAYMAVTGPAVPGGAWTEVAASPKLVKETEHPYLYSGTFKTSGNSDNMSLNAPLAANSDVWGKGWFRMVGGRPTMVDDYNQLITKVGPVGASGGGANWGFSLSPAGTYKATYDLALQRFRVVRIGN